MDISKGLSFHEARERISSTFHDIITTATRNVAKHNHSTSVFLYKILYLPSLLVAVLFIAAFIISNNSMWTEIMVTVSIILACILLNLCLVRLYTKSEEVEVLRSLETILTAYDAHCGINDEFIKSDSKNPLCVGSNLFSSSSASSAIDVLLTSGHSQVSIVHALRDGQWLRLPVLLLAKGDIVALMGGDITPGKCFEIERCTVETAELVLPMGHDSKTEIKWKLGREMQPGEKVHIRNKQFFSQQSPMGRQNQDADSAHEEVPLDSPSDAHLHYGNRHRTLAAESVEILSLSGDVRCFQMAETPVETFLHQVLSGQGKPTVGTSISTARDPAYASLSGEGGGIDCLGELPNRSSSLIRALFQSVVIKTGTQICIAILVVTIALLVVHMLASHAENNNISQIDSWDWVHSVLVPAATSFVFFLPLSLPAALIIAEATATADVLATAEVTLRPLAAKPKHTSSSLHLSPDAGSDYINTTAISGTVRDRVRMGSAGSEGEFGGGSGEGGSAEDMEDEFQDEDIDERVEDMAEEASTQVTWKRYFAYVAKVLHHRLFLRLGRLEHDEGTLDYLPIPLARSRVLEVLGAVTMVCFVDDDIICEGFSVTEEIFLLMDDHQQARDGVSSGNGNSASIQPIGKPGVEAEAHPKSAQAKGIVLDLHANPEATGSRFENPQWWRYLPSLKPLGLNAMLTYTHAHPHQNPSTEFANLHHSDGRGVLNSLPENSAQASQLIPPKTATRTREEDVAALGRFRSSTMPYPHSMPTTPVGTANGGTGSAQQHHQHHHHQCNQQQLFLQHTERALVRHIRHLLPQESLRELAEEIGFEQTDLVPFTRVLEVNVLAPGLENSHLLEDTHQWGQEESRRRGSLLPQLRGGIYKDYRDGSLQMMSLGDPSLVLNYCREYWDGSTRSITPLSSGDRAEVLSVYERWRLEDFEVVAFCYSPLPTAALQPLLAKKEESSPQHGFTRATSTSMSGVSSLSGIKSVAVASHSSGSFSGNVRKLSLGQGDSSFATSKHNTLFFVDPITTLDLQRVAAGITNKTKGATTKSTGSSMQRARTVPKPELTVFEAAEEFGVPNVDSEQNGVAVEGHGSKIADLSASGVMRRAATMDPSIRVCTRPVSDDAKVISVYANTATKEPGSQYKDNDHNRKSSHSDASYLTDSDAKSSVDWKIPRDGMVKSVSLDRVAGYARRPHSTGTVGGLQSEFYSPTTGNNSSSGSDILPALPLPLRESASARELGSNDLELTHCRIAPRKSTGDSPLLLFPDDDDESSSVTTDTSPLVHVVKDDFEFGCRIGVAGDRPASSDFDEGATMRRLSGGPLRRISSQSGISISSSPHLPAYTDDTDLNRSSGSFKFSGNSLTPPLAPRTNLSSKNKTLPRLYSPQLRKHASEYAPPHPFFQVREGNTTLGSFNASTNRQHRLQQQQQKSHQQSRQLRRASTRQLWTLMRQQVFLGMAASSVPVRKDVPNVKEDLDSAGVRFVYFSAQNMKRSKPVAEKIGIPFDWNCAISLRELEGGSGAQDPHRHISNYADWDVLARMPHGIDAIKAHLENVDNVPLLVSLFTDATPLSVQQMVDVFRDNGEVVLTIGGGYRSHNQPIYASADLGCSVSVLPGIGSTNILPADEHDLVKQFPERSAHCLCRADILLSFRLIGLTTVNFLQMPYRDDLARYSNNMRDKQTQQPYDVFPDVAGAETHASEVGLEQPLLNGEKTGPQSSQHLRLPVLLEVIRKGRILLRNMLQALAFFCVATVFLALWPVATLLVPINLCAAPSPGIALLFQCLYVPVLCLTILQCGEPEGVMKNTPRKNQLQFKPKDVQRFATYLALRCSFVLVSIVLVGWMGAASTLRGSGRSLGQRFHFLDHNDEADLAALALIRDLMSAQALLCAVSQASTLIVRGQIYVTQFPWPWRMPEALFYPVVLALICVHVGVLALREGARLHSHNYAGLDWPVWIFMLLLPLLGVLFGVLINRNDERHYRRYMQFLRLEFDTRLGMHSPR